MTKSEKLDKLDALLLDKYISAIENEELDAKDLAPIVTYLKNNKVVQDKKEATMSDVIDEVIE